jgi:Ring finger domain
MDECPICLGELVTTTKCGHKFHSSCIHKWLETNDSCPMCRDEVGVVRRLEREIESKDRMISNLFRSCHLMIENDFQTKLKNHYRIAEIEAKHAKHLRQEKRRVRLLVCILLALLFVILVLIWR